MMSAKCLLFVTAFFLLSCKPRKPLPVSKDLGPAVQVTESARGTFQKPARDFSDTLAEAEPNDEREQAQRLDPQKVLVGSLLPPTVGGAGKGQMDWYFWPAQKTNQLLTVELSGAPDLSIEAAFQNGHSLGLVDERRANEGERLSGVPVAAGQSLWFRVSGVLAAEAAHTRKLGEYRLAVSATDVPADGEIEPNDTLSQASAMSGMVATGALSTTRDTDVFVLELPTAPNRKSPPVGSGAGLAERAVLRLELTSPSFQPGLRVDVEPASKADAGAVKPTAIASVFAGKGKQELRLRNVTLPVGSARVFLSVSGREFQRPLGEKRYHLRAQLEEPLEDAELEPNDNCLEHANPLPLSSDTGEITGFLWPQDVDCFRVESESAADSAREARLDVPSGDCSATLTVLARDGKTVLSKGTQASKSSGAKPATPNDTKKQAVADGVSDGKVTSFSTSGVWFVRVASREGGVCFESPYRLQIGPKNAADGSKP